MEEENQNNIYQIYGLNITPNLNGPQEGKLEILNCEC
jgi:hypothetical protein